MLATISTRPFFRALLLKRNNDLVQPLVEQLTLDGSSAHDYAAKKDAHAALQLLDAWSAGALSVGSRGSDQPFSTKNIEPPSLLNLFHASQEASGGASDVHLQVCSPGNCELNPSPDGSLSGAVPGSDGGKGETRVGSPFQVRTSTGPYNRRRGLTMDSFVDPHFKRLIAY
jgi:hypothetical protein